LYLELEAVALTRDIPASLRWMVNPAVNHLSINSLTAALRQTRGAVTSLPTLEGSVPSCAARLRRADRPGGLSHWAFESADRERALHY
jgi:hypothetical protein